jgi:hypothetical protein
MTSRVKDQEYMNNFLKEYFLGLTQDQQVELFQQFYYELEIEEMVSGLPWNKEAEEEDGDYDATLYWADTGLPLVE